MADTKCIETKKLWFRIYKGTWKQEVYPSYIFEFPDFAYLSEEAAKEDLEEGEVVVNFKELQLRIAKDIQYDS